MSATTYDKGNISESIVMSAYLKAGFVVSIPFGAGAPYDLIVDADSRSIAFKSKRVGSARDAYFIEVNAELEKRIHTPRDLIRKARWITLQSTTLRQTQFMLFHSQYAVEMDCLDLILRITDSRS